MILLDFSQVIISNLMVHINMSKKNLVEEDLLRHMVLNSIRSYRMKFHDKYGEMILCCDGKDCWRKEIFPNYKINRKKLREKSKLDWNTLFDLIGKIKDELKEHMPYKVIHLDNIEADDIIATICMKYGTYKKDETYPNILIISGDKDFVQLQKYANVYQYSPTLKKWIVENNPERFLREHIILGDSSDGIPNFLSPDDTFAEGKRQKPVNRSKLAQWTGMNAKDFCSGEMLRNYQRNEMLVDLTKIPKTIQERIINEYESIEPNSRSQIIPYFMKYRLSNLTEKLGDF